MKFDFEMDEGLRTLLLALAVLALVIYTGADAQQVETTVLALLAGRSLSPGNGGQIR